MYYQKGTQRIEVIVKKEMTGSAMIGAKEKSADQIADNQNSSSKNVFGTNSERRKKRIILTNSTHILAVGMHLMETGLNYKIQGIGMEYGDQALQKHAERKMEMIKDPVSLASSIAMGAVYGAWGGPIGAIIGSSLGAIQGLASLSMKYSGREREFNYKVFKENSAIEYQRARARINLTTGRLR